MVKDSTIEELKDTLEGLKEREILLLILSSVSLNEVNPPLVGYLTGKKDYLAVYVTVSKSYKSLNKDFKDKGANVDNILYIDCASKLGMGTEMERSGNVVFLKPSQLTNISIALSETVDKLPEDREAVLFFDTLSTLMIYNNKDIVTKFAHALSSKMRGWDIKSIVLTADEDTSEEVKSRLKQFSDRYEEITD